MEFLNRLHKAHSTQPCRISHSASKALLLRAAFFDAEWYLSQYHDVCLAGMDPLDHYLRLGNRLARSPNPRFDAKWYLKRYPAVLDHAIDPAVHYLKWGRFEGRKIRAVGSSSPLFETVGRPRYVDHKVVEWDREREVSFLARINAHYAADASRYDSIPVSIVMPTYNRGYCIASAVESVLAQEHRHWTLIVSDDGSDDDTETVMGRYRDPRIICLRGPRKGVSAARNTALARCDGGYVFYLDSDNAWHPAHLRTMVVFMEAGRLDAAYSAALCTQGEGAGTYTRGDDFDWAACFKLNYVDMNNFAHRTELVGRHGGFDEELRRLVDWDLILRYTREHRTAFAPFVGVHYDDQPRPDRITTTEYHSGDDLAKTFNRIRAKHHGFTAEATGATAIRPLAEGLLTERVPVPVPAAPVEDAAPALRIGYVLWDWPALSQTFVINEIRALLARGHDVKVYYKTPADQTVELDFDVDARQVADADELERLCRLHARSVLHSPFVYPTATLMTWPVAERLRIPFTLMAGGVDVAHYENIKRNRVGEMASSPLCLGIVTLGSFHRDLLIECGVPSNKLALERQTVDLPAPLSFRRDTDRRPRVVCIARFIEKKGIAHLIRAAAELRHVDVHIHGHGPLEADYRRLIDELGLENVVIGGALTTRKALFDVYAETDLFVLPCMRAANGDLDGLPTVLLEAMAAGVPVVTSAIANTPDLIVDGVTGFLAQPADADSLGAALQRCLALEADDRARLVAAARRRAVGYAGSDRAMETLLARWTRRKIDIVLVTYDVPGYANVEDTLEIIRRTYDYTVMDFELYVVDNASDAAFKDALRSGYGDRSNFHLIELEQNIFCGPAANRGFAAGDSEYIVYVCSKEGFVLRHGWDLHLTRAMDARPKAAIGGYPVELPKFRTGLEMQSYPSFESWRARDFARTHPERRFRHIQGGAFILRRDVFERTGGFSPTVVQNGMDVEYSYYLESQGYELATITGLYAVTTKTLPQLASLIDEHAYLVHPSTAAEISALDRVVGRKTRYCNLCEWQGDAFVAEPDGCCGTCPRCGASAFDRSAYRILSQSGILQTRPEVAGRTRTRSLDAVLAKPCPRRRIGALDSSAPASLAAAVAEAQGSGVLVLDHTCWQGLTGEAEALTQQLTRYVDAGGLAVIAEPLADATALDAVVVRLADTPVFAAGVDLISDACRFDTRRVYVFAGVALPADLQGLDA